MVHKKLNSREEFNYKGTEIEGNFYPITSAIAMKDFGKKASKQN